MIPNPIIPDWTALPASSIAGQVVFVYRTAPNVVDAPPFPVPNGWMLLFPDSMPTVANGQRWYTAIRQTVVTNPPMSATAPIIAGWEPWDSPTSIAAAIVWGFRTAPNLDGAPPFPVPAGFELLVAPTGPTVDGGQRWYALIREVGAPPPPVGGDYSVDAGETLHVTTTLQDATGAWVPRTWVFMNQCQTGYNAAFWVPDTTPPDQLILQEFDAWTTDNEIDHTVTINPDPYTVSVVPPGGDLRAAIAGAPNLTRLLLSGKSNYTVTKEVFVDKRLQLVSSGPGVTVTIDPQVPAGWTEDPRTGRWVPEHGHDKGWPAFYFLNSSAVVAQITLIGINFTGPAAMRLDASTHKTGISALHTPMGMLTMVACSFRRMDQGVQLDSTPKIQCDGVLFLNCNANDGTMRGVPIWGAGRNVVVEGCSLGPSTQEHPLRFSIVNLQTNQVPQFIRIGNSTLTAVKQSTLAKECLAIRDAAYVCVDNVDGNNWAECGQKLVQPWDEAHHILINQLRLSFDTLHLRLGVTGPITVQNCTTVLPIVVGVPASTPVTLMNNTTV